ncbi:MAG: hypothetical protein CMO01_11925 [Thalassobius sp.]|nr:hypothetical protein [Thalassovita sp.]|tara:strand:+ start:16671 stop:17210 length:540 start_codon:yes stop_codon:yes gene_type:complete
MSETIAICYLDDKDNVVGLKYDNGIFKVNEGTPTEKTLPYPYERIFPTNFLIVDNGAVRVYTTEELAMQGRIEEAERARNKAINEPIVVHGEIWKMNLRDRNNIQDGIDEAAMNNLPDDYKQDWIMADGSIFIATPLKLKQVLAAYRQRKKQIYDHYIAWLSAGAIEDYHCDCNNEFTY